MTKQESITAPLIQEFDLTFTSGAFPNIKAVEVWLGEFCSSRKINSRRYKRICRDLDAHIIKKYQLKLF